MATATNANSVAQANNAFLFSSMERNFVMPASNFSQAGQTIDIELESVPGWAQSVELDVLVDLAVTVATGGTAPSKSSIAPWNIFSTVELSLGGGPFHRVSPYFYYLRDLAMHPGWNQSYSGPNSYSYSNNVYSVPAISATAGSTTDNYWAFKIQIPLQYQHGGIYGFLPLGNSSVKAKLRLTVQPNLYGTDQYLNPVVGGTDVTVAIGTAKQSYVRPSIWYRTTSPAQTQPLPTPTIQKVLNVQERTTQFVGAGSATPIKFPDPFVYLRLWHVLIDGTGAPNSLSVQQFELDPAPGYPQYQFPDQQSMNDYWGRTRRLYRQDLPDGVFVMDLWAGSSPENPNGTQSIDASLFQTMQTQLAVTSTTNVASPAKIITYAEALSPVGF